MRLLAVMAAAAMLMATQTGPKIFYSKSFPGSTPAYASTTLNKDGSAEYREAPDEADPIKIQLTAEETKAIFDLAEKLDHFKRELESGLKVARTGDKIFRWEDGAEKHEVKFNYTQDLDGQALLDWFERITESETHLINLERTARFDKLGVNKVLLQLQASWERKRLVAAAQYLKMLDRVAKNESYLNMARERAAMLAQAIRAEQTPKAGE